MSSTPTYSFLLTSFKSGRVFANTTWAWKTGPGPNIATLNSGVISRVGTINPATHFGHIQGQTGCGESTNAEKRLQSVDFYLCPGDHPDTSCQEVYEFFCPYWTCATCNQSLLTSLNASVSYQAPNNTWLACTSGLTRCINGTEPGPVLCMLVHVLPQVYVYSGPEGQHLIISPGLHSRFRRSAPLFVPVLVGLSVAGSAAIGTAALVKGETGLMSLSQHVDADLGNLQSAIHMLHTQGSLCATLGESCCFYANQFGVVKDTLQRVRENLDKCQQEQENSPPWYQNMFNWSPWLTTLLTGLAGPLLLLLLHLIFGPCILNWLLNFIRQRTALVKFIHLRTQYNPLVVTEESML
ncbi:Endogenous retrovirus group S71 member 1 Env polyprotein [Plecturocebus cupreus]